MCQEIRDSLGKKKIGKFFLVDVDFMKESLAVKSLKCLSAFINQDYSAKPWNHYSHFSNCINPKENSLLWLRDDQFNMKSYCALTVL